MTASLTIWIRNNIYNSQHFADTLVSAITTESSRTAIAGQITDKVYENRPIAGRVLADPTQNVIESLLKNDRFSNVLTTVATKVNQRITTGNTSAIVIDISSFSTVINAVKQVIAPTADFTVPTGDAAKITLLKANALPDIHRFGQFLLILLPITLLGLAALAIATWVKIARKATWFKLVGLVFVISSVLLITFNYTGGSLLSSYAQTPNESIILQNIYSAFTVNFEHFQYMLGSIGVVLVAFGYSVERRNWPAELFNAARRSVTKSVTKPAKSTKK
jgi:hypothetical protein